MTDNSIAGASSGVLEVRSVVHNKCVCVCVCALKLLSGVAQSQKQVKQIDPKNHKLQTETANRQTTMKQMPKFLIFSANKVFNVKL